MKLKTLIVIAVAGVTIVAGIKTLALSSLLVEFAQWPSLTIATIFAGFWLLTAAVALGGFFAVRRFVEAGRRSRILSAIAEEPGKENLLETHAAEWGLTRAEIDVAIMVIKGFSNAEIAAMRGTAVQTVKTQLGAIYQKSGLENRYQLIAYITDEVCETSKAPAPEMRQPDPAPCATTGHLPGYGHASKADRGRRTDPMESGGRRLQ